MYGAEKTGNYRQGRAYVYEFDTSTGEWLDVQRLSASDGEANDRFATNVSLSGDRVGIACDVDAFNGNSEQGSVYVYTVGQTDCDANGVIDSCEIADGSANDSDDDGLLDACEKSPPCPADLDGDGVVSGSDLTVVLGAWGINDSPADFNGDGHVDGADLAVVLGAWGACPE